MSKRFLVSLFAVFLTILGFSQSHPDFKKIKIGDNPDAGHYISTRGFKMYYEIYGQGFPLLIIHGNGGSINNFSKQVPYFSQNFKVILADSRSQGKSVDPNDSLSYEMMTDDLNALLDTLKLDSCYVLGWSDGGIDGLLLAIRHPEKVRKLAITGANLWPDTTAVDPYAYYSTIKYCEELLKKEQTPAIKNAYKLNNMMIYEPQISLEQLHTISCPTLVIGGDHDVILPEHTMLIFQNIKDSYLWILPESGHSTLINYAEQFNKTVNDFFQKPYRKIEGDDRFN